MSKILDVQFYSQIKEILASARSRAYSVANTAMVEAYWQIGKSIVEKQGGEQKAEYGSGLIKALSAQMTKDFGKGFTTSNIKYMRQFFLTFPNRHLMKVENELARQFYLIEHLQKFLLELGRGFSFVARQKRISFDGQHFFIDLLFYNYLLKFFVIIDLKTGKLTHQDIGQMQMYVNYYTREMMSEGDHRPIGIILCADKSDAVIKYTLPENDTQIFASKYKLYLPSEEELKNELESEYRALVNNQLL